MRSAPLKLLGFLGCCGYGAVIGGAFVLAEAEPAAGAMAAVGWTSLALASLANHRWGPPEGLPFKNVLFFAAFAAAAAAASAAGLLVT